MSTKTISPIFGYWLILLLVFPLLASGQITKIDSLKSLLKPIKADTNRVNTLVSIATKYYPGELENSITYGELALDLSKQIEFNRGIAESNYVLAKAYNRNGDPKAALQYYSDASKVYIKLRNRRRLGAIYNNVGIIYKNQGLYRKSLKYYEESLGLYKNIANVSGVARTYVNMGNIYRNLGDYTKAIALYIQGLKEYEKMDNKEGVAASYANLANLYTNQKDFKKALEYNILALEKLALGSNRKSEGTVLNNIGLIHLEQKNYDESLNYLEKASSLFSKINDKPGQGMCLVSIGTAYDQKGELEKALKNYKEALVIFQESDNRAFLAATYVNMGDIYTRLSDYDRAFENIRSGLLKSREIGNPETELKANLALFEYYKRTGDFETALDYHVQSTTLKDSIFNKAKSKQLAEVLTKYETEKKEVENEILRKDQQVQKEIGARKNVYIGALVLGVFMLSTFAIYFYNNNKQKIKINRLLSEQNAKIEQKRKQIAAINSSLKKSEIELNKANEKLIEMNMGLENIVVERTKKLQEANEELDTFLYQSSHALRRPIAQVKGLIQLARMEDDQQGIEDVYNKIDDTSTRMDLMLKKLVMASEINLARPKPEQINFKALIEETWLNIGRTLNTSSVDLHQEVDGDIDYSADRRMVNIIFTNILENSVLYQSNHRYRNANVTVNVSNGNGELKINVRDNGMGIATTVLPEVFNLFSIGTDRTKGYGLGLYIVKKAVEKLDGKIAVESEENQFTSFDIVLPTS